MIASRCSDKNSISRQSAALSTVKQMGAERIIAMSRHESRQKLAREFGATDSVTERGDEGVARITELTGAWVLP